MCIYVCIAYSKRGKWPGNRGSNGYQSVFTQVRKDIGGKQGSGGGQRKVVYT